MIARQVKPPGNARAQLARRRVVWESFPVTIERDEWGFDAPVPLGHPARLGRPADHPTGPKVGEVLPDFELPDIAGRRVRFHEDRAGAKSVVVFFRSAVW